jgi:hypothetical protein
MVGNGFAKFGKLYGSPKQLTIILLITALRHKTGRGAVTKYWEPGQRLLTKTPISGESAKRL